MCKFCNLDDNREIFASANFRVIVSLGALVEGWLLVVPKQHMLALAEMTPALEAEYDLITKRYRSLLTRRYGPVAEFEHGPGECNSQVGCTIDHAHSHLVPTSVDLLAGACKGLPEADWRLVSGPTSLASDHAKRQSYLFLRQNGRAWAAVAATVPSQFFRRIIAQEMRLGEYDWRKDRRVSIVTATLKSFS